MALNEGYTMMEIQTGNSYELLQLSYTINNFYWGKRPPFRNKKTPIKLDEIAYCTFKESISFGNLNDGFYIILCSELVELFEHDKNFTNPYESKYPFDAMNIRKLKLLSMERNMELYNMIMKVENLNRKLLTLEDKFRYKYEISTQEIQGKIRDV